MKRTKVITGLLLTLVTPLGAVGQQLPDAVREPQKISASLRNVPFRSAITTLFLNTGHQYSVDADVLNNPVSLVVKDVNFDAALRLLISQAAIGQPGIYLEKKSDVYIIRVRETPQPERELLLTKVLIRFQNAADLVMQLERVGASRDIEKIAALPSENALLIQATKEETAKLIKVIGLLDVSTQMFSVRIGVTGPGVGGRPFQFASMTRTLNGKEVVIDEQTTSAGETARLRVQVRPVSQGDGEVLAESDWDLSIPVGGGPKGPIRLVKRLATTTRLRVGRSITIGEVDLTPFGGNGTVRLWLRADLVRQEEWVPTSTQAGETISTVRVLGDKPYLSASWLAHTLRGQLRRGGSGQYEIRPGLTKDPQGIPDGERPTQPGPFRLTRGTLLISEQLEFGGSAQEASRLLLDTDGEPLIPLADLARTLGGRMQYDSAADSYRIVGGTRLSALRFPGSDAKDR